MAERVIVTGINGFVGKHLTRELVDNGIEVVGVGREDDIHGDIAHIVKEYYQIDMTKEWPAVMGDAVIHLAGLATVGPSFDAPQDYLNLNSAMLTHMAEYYLSKEHKPRIIVISSGAIYDPHQPMPITEESQIGYTSPYAVSKVLNEAQCKYYRSRGLECVVVRPFNHIGPGQLPGFLIPDVIEQLSRGDKITVGNITTKRDYTDVRDIARAYRLLATTSKLHFDIYNACSGRSIQGEKIVELIKTAYDKPHANVLIDKSKMRPTDPIDIYGDYSRLNEDTGWMPEIPLEQTILDIAGTNIK
ncbi:MAG: NAD-dependent epimerase/dehydratase family protein [Candidatus Saccharimonas sp.]|nr:NAD-dependent epimerase/dehydratase family protein [Candidatus Saccharimonas sp.]